MPGNCREIAEKLIRAPLFGSTNKDIFNSDSDIAVVVDSFKGDIVDIFSLLLKLRRNIDIRIEPHPFEVKDFNDSNPVQLVKLFRIRQIQCR